MNHYKLVSWEGVYSGSFNDRAAFLEKIFSIVTVISMCLCFFSLSSSMTANIFEQSREISIMLALGFTKAAVTRIFVYEALILVISSAIAGFFIGIFIGNLMLV